MSEYGKTYPKVVRTCARRRAASHPGCDRLGAQPLRCSITCVSEIVGAFLWSEFRDQGADAAPETANGSFRGLTQESFELGKSQFGWVEVGRVLRQVEKR